MLSPKLHFPAVQKRIDLILGDHSEPMDVVEQRLYIHMPDEEALVWEVNPGTFRFNYVSQTAESIFGYPQDRWVNDPDFWKNVIVHPDDRNDAVGFYALAIGRGEHHNFFYRGVTAGGQVRRIYDVLRVVPGRLGVTRCLRGVMIAMSDEDYVDAQP